MKILTYLEFLFTVTIAFMLSSQKVKVLSGRLRHFLQVDPIAQVVKVFFDGKFLVEYFGYVEVANQIILIRN